MLRNLILFQNHQDGKPVPYDRFKLSINSYLSSSLICSSLAFMEQMCYYIFEVK